MSSSAKYVVPWDYPYVPLFCGLVSRNSWCLSVQAANMLIDKSCEWMERKSRPKFCLQMFSDIFFLPVIQPQNNIGGMFEVYLTLNCIDIQIGYTNGIQIQKIHIVPTQIINLGSCNYKQIIKLCNSVGTHHLNRMKCPSNIYSPLSIQ